MESKHQQTYRLSAFQVTLEKQNWFCHIRYDESLLIPYFLVIVLEKGKAPK